jgi:hypothetical protein
MSSTDRSQTERIRRIRAQLQAVRRAECAACPELGPQGPTDQSTWLSRRFGQAPYRREAANGDIQTQSCCDSTVTCDASTINFDDLIIFLKTQIPEPKTVSITFTTDGITIFDLVPVINGTTLSPTTKPIFYIQSDTIVSLADSNTYFYVNNSPNTINVTSWYDGEQYTIQLSPCGAW